MGLPVIKKLKKYSQHDYYTYCIEQTKKLSSKDYDWYTNENGKEILFKLKDFLAVSYSYVVTMRGLLSSFDKVAFVCDVDPMFAEYKQEYIVARVKRNMARMLSSLKSQRYIAHKMKDVVKNNALTKEWTDAFEYFIDQMYKRLDTISSITYENLECTPYILYVLYLKKNNQTFVDDLKDIFGKEYYGHAYTLNYADTEELVVNHICDIFSLAAKDTDLISECVSNANQYNQAVNDRRERRKKEAEKRNEEILKSRREEAVDILNTVACTAEKKYISSLKNDKARDLVHYRVGYKPFYIIASIDINIYKHGYNYYLPKVLYTSCNMQKHTRTCDITNSRKFSTLEEAESYMAELAKEKPNLVMTVCKIDLAWKGVA